MVKRQGRTGKPYNVAFSSKRLKGRIVEVYGSAARFAAAMEGGNRRLLLLSGREG